MKKLSLIKKIAVGFVGLMLTASLAKAETIQTIKERLKSYGGVRVTRWSTIDGQAVNVRVYVEAHRHEVTLEYYEQKREEQLMRNPVYQAQKAERERKARQAREAARRQAQRAKERQDRGLPGDFDIEPVQNASYQAIFKPFLSDNRFYRQSYYAPTFGFFTMQTEVLYPNKFFKAKDHPYHGSYGFNFDTAKGIADKWLREEIYSTISFRPNDSLDGFILRMSYQNPELSALTDGQKRVVFVEQEVKLVTCNNEPVPTAQTRKERLGFSGIIASINRKARKIKNFDKCTFKPVGKANLLFNSKSTMGDAQGFFAETLKELRVQNDNKIHLEFLNEIQSVERNYAQKDYPNHQGNIKISYSAINPGAQGDITATVSGLLDEFILVTKEYMGLLKEFKKQQREYKVGTPGVDKLDESTIADALESFFDKHDDTITGLNEALYGDSAKISMANLIVLTRTINMALIEVEEKRKTIEKEIELSIISLRHQVR